MPPNFVFRGICKFLVAALNIGFKKKCKMAASS